MKSDTMRVVALGFFDGVHRGHQAILKEACLLARAKGVQSAALTFQNHPRAFIKGKNPDMITTFDRRLALLREQGMDEVIALPFDKQMAHTSPEDFVALLREQYGVCAVVCGENFRFGAKAAGSPQTFRELGMEVHSCAPVAVDGQMISSTLIRTLVRAGEVEQANQFLGRPFCLEGPVEGGTQTGRRIGYPTANVGVEEGVLLPARGVYITDFVLEEAVLRAVTNVGSRPTFTQADIVSVESHLLNFDRAIYGQACRVNFLQFIRPEQAFSSPDELIVRIGQDAAMAAAYRA